MKKSSKFLMLLFVVAIFGITGCATNRGIVTIKVPKNLVKDVTNGKEIFIKSVTDERVFQEKPKTQDIPSLGFGGTAKATEIIKKRAIGRKRNTWGKALGDILLEEGQTVESVVKDTLTQAFIEKGYKIINAKHEVSKKTIILTAKINKFWAYMTPGFWSIKLSSDISSNIKMTQHGNEKKSINVHSEGKYQGATEGNWMEIINLSIQKFITELKKEI
jgi:hypothetical protein